MWLRRERDYEPNTTIINGNIRPQDIAGFVSEDANLVIHNHDRGQNSVWLNRVGQLIEID